MSSSRDKKSKKNQRSRKKQQAGEPQKQSSKSAEEVSAEENRSSEELDSTPPLAQEASTPKEGTSPSQPSFTLDERTQKRRARAQKRIFPFRLRRTPKGPNAGRRNLLRTATGAGVGLLFLRAGWNWYQKRKPPAQKIIVTEHCIGCTGCAAICPTLAIEIIPGSIAVIEERCISCGYCQTSCGIDGIRVLQENNDVEGDYIA